MPHNAYTDPLMCEITHRAQLFLSFGWYTTSFGLLFLWEKMTSFFCWFGVSSCFRRRCRQKPTVVIGELFVLRDGRITPLAAVKNTPSEPLGLSSSLISPVASSSSLATSSSVGPSSVVACSLVGPSSSACLSSSSVLSSSFAASGSHEFNEPPFPVRSTSVTSIKLNVTCYSLDCACVAGLPCLAGGRMPSFRPPLQNYSSSVSFAVGCEAIFQAFLETDVGSLGFGRECSTSSVTSLAFGQAFPLGDTANPIGCLPAVSSAMEVNNVSVPVSGVSGFLGVDVASPPPPSGLSAALAPAADELCGVSVPPPGDSLLSASVPSAGVEFGSVVGGCSAGADSVVAEAPVATLPRPVTTPRRRGSGRCVAVASAVVADVVAATAVDAPLSSPRFSPPPCEKRQRRDKQTNVAPTSSAIVRPCFNFFW
ncbi:hypothetical protein INT47_010416 [Mucor saturninus]|uniref:Uncharacterized protein n=1 Tax=Mucor saturninus TaxID=64648 RepID=A0A8H7QKG7_9FUNG|nr:hypothetical protein INT47_010416 [Mucor saturninus]